MSDGPLRDRQERTAAGAGLTSLALLAVVVLGAPQVWADLRSGALGLASVFFPVLGVALAHLAVSGRPPR